MSSQNLNVHFISRFTDLASALLHAEFQATLMLQLIKAWLNPESPWWSLGMYPRSTKKNKKRTSGFFTEMKPSSVFLCLWDDNEPREGEWQQRRWSFGYMHLREVRNKGAVNEAPGPSEGAWCGSVGLMTREPASSTPTWKCRLFSYYSNPSIFSLVSIPFSHINL